MKPILLFIALLQLTSHICCGQDTTSIKLALGEKDYKDYLNWVALGIGGLPHTLEGYRTVKQLNAQMKDPLDVSRIAGDIGKPGDIKTLFDLPNSKVNLQYYYFHNHLYIKF